MTPRGERFLLIIMIAMLIVVAMYALSSCAAPRPQPMGENVWKAL